MKTKLVSLLLCWFVLIPAIALIVAIGFLALDFHWIKVIGFSAIAALVHSILLKIGKTLDNHFSDVVKNFVNGHEQTLQPSIALQRTYSILLVTLLPFLIYLLLLALFLAISFVDYGFRPFTSPGRFQLAAAIGLGIVGIGTLVAFGIALRFLLFAPKVEIGGIDIIKNEQPKIWHLVESVANHSRAKPIDCIVLTPNPGIGVCQQGYPLLSIMGKGTRTVVIGVPSLHNLTVGEFSAILAHEFGHFVNRDTQWSAFINTMKYSLLSAIEATPGPFNTRSKSVLGCLVALIVYFNPAHWLLKSYVDLFLRITRSFSRMCEVKADIHAMTLYGGFALKSSLIKLCANDYLFDGLIRKIIIPMLSTKQKTISSITESIDFVKISFFENNINIHRFSTCPENQEPYDTHPPRQIRMHYARQFFSEAFVSDDDIKSIFNCWYALDRRVTRMFYANLIQTPGNDD
ncbi:M48 family metalloprotease [Planctomycetota bacterium]